MAWFAFLVMTASISGVHINHFHGGPLTTDQHVPGYKYKNLEEFNEDLQNRIKSQYTADNRTVGEIVDVAFSRLGLYDRSYRHCDNRQPLTEAFKQSILSDNSTDVLNGHGIYTLFHRVLSVAVYTFNNGPCCLQGPTEGCLQPVEDFFNTLSVLEIYNVVKSKYNRHALLENIDDDVRLKYAVESYANRLQCIDERSVLSTFNVSHIADEKRTKHIMSTIIVFYILKGYNFLGKDDICPFAFIYSIYRHYGGRDKMPEHELMRMVRDLRDCQPSHQGPESHPHMPQSDGRTGSGSGHFPFRRTENTERVREIERPHGHSDPNHVLSAGQNKDLFDKNFWRTIQHGQFQTGNLFLHEASYKYFSDRKLHMSEQCFDTQKLIDIFTGRRGGGSHDNIRVSLFMDMCPALLQQSLLSQCPRQHQPYHPHRTTVSHTAHAPSTQSPSVSPANSTHYDPGSNNTVTAEKITRYKSYLYGSLSVLVISLCSLLGAGFIKLSGASVKTYMMGSMLALAVGCLVADAALHLLPEVILNGNEAVDTEFIPDYLRKLCAFLGSIYTFFVLEMILSIRHTHSHALDSEHELIQSIRLQYTKDDNAIRETNFTLNNRPTKPNNSQFPKTTNIDHEHNSSPSTSPSTSSRTPPRLKQGAGQVDDSIQVLESRCSNASDRISIHDSKSGIEALAWMIIIGDGIHNFADGLAIGAAFALTFTKGISTSITVVCHELPHELGDFAILVSTGMSIKRAMLLNFLSSLTAFAGLYVGLALGTQGAASQWIFAVGAGMFLYVALTDLIPECKEYFKKKCTIKMFLGQNLGLLVGYASMLLLAVYEDKLEIKA